MDADPRWEMIAGSLTAMQSMISMLIDMQIAAGATTSEHMIERLNRLIQANEAGALEGYATPIQAKAVVDQLRTQIAMLAVTGEAKPTWKPGVIQGGKSDPDDGPQS